MTACAWLLLGLAIAGAAFGLWQWGARRRTLRRLNDMLDRAIAGGFAEGRFDETALSALEGKFARFLRGSAAAKKTAEKEQAAGADRRGGSGREASGRKRAGANGFRNFEERTGDIDDFVWLKNRKRKEDEAGGAQ